MSCQFPIVDIWDFSSNNTDNPNRNGWVVTKEFPPEDQIKLLGVKKMYNATVWARVDETLTFHTKFGAGSHIRVRWTIEEPSTVSDNCTTITSTQSFPTPTPPGDLKVLLLQAQVLNYRAFPIADPPFYQTTADVDCVFPFRYKDVLYYGCTNVSLSGTVYKMCATKVTKSGPYPIEKNISHSTDFSDRHRLQRNRYGILWRVLSRAM